MVGVNIESARKITISTIQSVELALEDDLKTSVYRSTTKSNTTRWGIDARTNMRIQTRSSP